MSNHRFGKLHGNRTKEYEEEVWDADELDEYEEEGEISGTVTTNKRKRETIATRTFGLLTLKPLDGIKEDTKERVMDILARTVIILASLFSGAKAVGSMEYNEVEWAPIRWMHFWLYHGHILFDWIIPQEKNTMRLLVKQRLMDLWGECMFNRGWFVFGDRGVKQKHSFLNYIRKQNFPEYFGGCTKEEWQWHNFGKVFDPEKCLEFNYGVSAQEMRWSAARVLERILYLKKWKWYKSGNYCIWFNMQDENVKDYQPLLVYEAMCNKVEYRVLMGKLGSAIKWNLMNANENLNQLKADLDHV